MRYSSAEIFDIQTNAYQFSKWIQQEAECCEIDYMSHVKNSALLAFNRELSEKQKRYFRAYFMEGKTVTDIANLYGVNKSTVSRTLTVAKNKLRKVLVYSAPHLHSATETIRNRRL